MNKNRFTEQVAKRVLTSAKIEHNLLVNAMFTPKGHDYVMGDLTIYGGNGYYYYTPNGDRKPLKNMQQVSDLVYGNTPYLVM